MTSRTTVAIVAAAVVLASVVQVAPAAALPTRTWVAKSGDDHNPCTVTAPCATLQAAHLNTAPGGTISVLTPGDYGPVLISKAINITNDAVGEAGILSGGSSGVTIQAGSGDVVSMRGLVIDGQGAASGFSGIVYRAASAVHVQNCVIRNFQTTGPNGSNGITVELSGTDRGKLFVSDTLVSDNGRTGTANGYGISAQAVQSASLSVVLNRVRVENNAQGIAADNSVSAAMWMIVRDSVVSGNGGDGIFAGTTSFVFVTGSSVVDSGNFGIQTLGSGAILMSKTTVARNGVGLASSLAGRIVSYRNNEIDNNLGPDGAPTAFNAPR